MEKAVRKEKVALDQCKKWIRCANCQFSLIKNQCRTRPNSVQEIVNILNLTMKEYIVPLMAQSSQVTELSRVELRKHHLEGCLAQYTAAACFVHFLKTNELLPSSALPTVNATEYLLGVIILSKELLRYAIVRATEKDYEAVFQCYELVFELNVQLRKFAFRNSKLRVQYDSLKYTMKKLTKMNDVAKAKCGKNIE